MGYLDENGLARYDDLIKNWVTFKSETVDGVDPLLNWQKTETAASVAFYPLPAAPLDPVVTFAFTETPPASGDKSPDNPSTITGVSTITVTRCETVGVDSTDYTIDLGGTYFGGSVDLSAGTMTVTWVGFSLTGTENELYLYGHAGVDTRLAYNLIQAGFPYPLGGANDSVCSHSSSFDPNNEAIFGNYYVRVNGYFVMQDKNNVIGTTIDNYKAWVASQYANGTPIRVAYKIATPYIVQLTPTQIYSLSQPDPYIPRINTVYSDQVSVQVGYPKSPQASQTELTNAIVSLGGNV